MSDTTLTVLVVLRDEPRALTRLLVRCHGRGWKPVSLRSVSDGTRCEVSMRLAVPPDRRGTDAQVRAQLARLVDAEHVAVDSADGVPDGVAFAAVRRKAPWLAVAA
jgi:acetolactate synthase regulatory subunit